MLALLLALRLVLPAHAGPDSDAEACPTVLARVSETTSERLADGTAAHDAQRTLEEDSHSRKHSTLVNQTYDRLIATAVGVARGDDVSRADLEEFEAVRREYARINGHDLVFSAVAASVPSSASVLDVKLRDAVAEYLGARSPVTASAVSPIDLERHRRVQVAYLKAKLYPLPEDPGARAEAEALVKGVDWAYGLIREEFPKDTHLLSAEEDSTSMMAVRLYFDLVKGPK